ncbi:unnamed protein product [Allacma fusca]|uniref:Uncharacterized protein n=1 Tax=Allacma fusca TaxID=39272 RepID=A0A8J2PJ10_9HEXA|nr:unnamed protein product [Allacma fusca]
MSHASPGRDLLVNHFTEEYHCASQAKLFAEQYVHLAGRYNRNFRRPSYTCLMEAPVQIHKFPEIVGVCRKFLKSEFTFPVTKIPSFSFYS